MFEPETVGEQRFRVMGTSISPQFVFTESDRIAECIEFAAANGIGVAVAPLGGFHLTDLSFVRQFPLIDRLTVLDAEMMDISAINSLHQLRYLQVSGKPRQEIVVENFPLLEELRVWWWAKLNMRVQHPRLRVLSLWNYGHKRGLLGLPSLPLLSKLHLVKSPLLALSGIEQFGGLTELTISNLPNLASIAPLADSQNRDLVTLELDKCRGVADHERVRALKGLSRLAFNYCGEIGSLGFLDDLPHLKSFSFVRTTILDGDLTPCLRLEFVGFDDDPRYSHRSADFNNDSKLKGVD